MIVALVGVGAASIHFLARPHIFTLLLLSISVWMVEVGPPEILRGGSGCWCR